MRLSVNLIIAAIAFVLGVAYLYGITFIRTLPFGDPLGPKAFPILLGVAMLFAAALLVFEAWRKPAALPAEAAGAVSAPPSRSGQFTVLGIVLWTALYFWTFEGLGYVLSSTLYIFPLAYWFNGRKLAVNGLTAALFSLTSYLMFTRLLEVTLPPGILPF
jgi:putative tricarboxylic transport membrane protein